MGRKGEERRRGGNGLKENEKNVFKKKFEVVLDKN